MALTPDQTKIAKEIVGSWNWQLAEGHNYRFKHAVKTLVRFYEQPSMEADVFKLVLEYLRSEKNISSVALNQKRVELEGVWNAKDAWYQTANGDKFENVDQERVRIYQVLVGKDTDGDEGDGPYLIENGVTYAVTRKYFWDVEEAPEPPEQDDYGIITKIEGLTRDHETGLYSYVIEKREEVEVPVSSETVRATRRGVYRTTESMNVDPEMLEDGSEAPLVPGVGESIERSITPGNLRSIKKIAFESAASEGAIKLAEEHQLSAFVHEDSREEVLDEPAGGASAEPETDKLVLEDVQVTSPLPTDKEGQHKGFAGTGDIAGAGTGRKLTRTRLVFNDETGQMERRVIEQTSHPYKKILTWKADKAAHKMIVFRDLEEVPNFGTSFTVGTTSYDADDVSPQIQITEFGLFSGVISCYKSLRDTSSGGSVDETGFNKGKEITIKERYTKPGGRNYIRTYTVTKHWMHGTASAAADAYGNGTEYPYLGLRASFSTSGQRGKAEWYDGDLKLISDEPEA